VKLPVIAEAGVKMFAGGVNTKTYNR